MKILNLNLPQVKKIKNELSRLYGPTTRTLTDKLKEIQVQTITYGCSIPALDQLLLLEDNLCSQSFWEICGPTDDLCVLVVYLHLANDVWHGEPHAGIYPWRRAHACHLGSSAFQGKERLRE